MRLCLLVGWGLVGMACQPDTEEITRTIVNCDRCSVIIDSEDPDDRVVTRNELICVDSAGIVTGNIRMEGGQFCSIGEVVSPSIELITGEFNNYDTLITDELIINDRSAFYNYGYVRITDRLEVNSNGALYQQGTIEVEGDFVNNGVVSGLQDEECYPIVIRGQSINQASGSLSGNLDLCDDSAPTLDISEGSIEASVTFCACP